MAEKWKSEKKIFRDTWIRSLKGNTNLQIIDAQIPGLHLRFYHATKKKVFYLNYKITNTKIQRNLLIARYGECGLDEVRKRALQYKQMITDGQDPMLERIAKKKKIAKEQAARIKVSELIDVYHEKYSKLHKKPSTIKSERYLIEGTIKPMLGDIYIGDLELPMIIDFYNKIAEKNSFQTAAHGLGLVSAFWNWCETYGHLPINTNPCGRVPRGKDKKKKFKTLNLDEYKKLMVALDEGINRHSPYSPSMFRALKILLLTGCRTNEITKLKKANLDLDNNFIYLDDSKNGEDKHPLGNAAVEELRKALAASPKDSERLFPATRGGADAVLDLRKAHLWALERAGLPMMRKHDFRHSFISIGTNKTSASIHAVSRTIGHSRITTTEGYSHAEDLDRVETAEEITALICG